MPSPGEHDELINVDAVCRSPYNVNWSPWMDDPCYLCGQPIGDGPRWVDFGLMVVSHEGRCP